MRILDRVTVDAVQAIIDAHQGMLEAVTGFVSAEPGFPIVDGRIVREPAILVFVAHKKDPSSVLQEDRIPRQLWERTVSP